MKYEYVIDELEVAIMHMEANLKSGENEYLHDHYLSQIPIFRAAIALLQVEGEKPNA